jgi:hypothetical protein
MRYWMMLMVALVVGVPLGLAPSASSDQVAPRTVESTVNAAANTVASVALPGRELPARDATVLFLAGVCLVGLAAAARRAV